MDARSGRPRLAAIAFALLLLPGLVYGSSAAFSSGSVPAPSLTVEVAGATDLGRVTSDPPGIDCGSDCDEEYGATTTVELTAEAQGDATFEGWSGNPDCSTANPCTVQVDEEESVTATFSAPARRITVTKTGTGQGTVTSTPGGINCGATCFADFPHDPSAQVTLFASPADGSAFEGWSGGGCAGTSTCVLRPTQDLSVTANFGPASFGSQPIVFSAQREGVHGHYEIWKMNGDGSSEVQLTRTSPGLTNYLPVLSADGTTIAFVRTDTDGNGSQIFLMDADGTNERQLTSDPPDSDVDYGQGSFSPDGRSFVVGGNVRPRTSGGLCRSLAIVEIPSGDTTNLVEECVGGSLSYGDPVFTPDGESIVYRREFEDTGELSIFKMDVETRDETEVFRPPATATAGDGAIEPAVSPDGSLIAFRLFGSDVVEGNTRFINQIFVVGSDGSGARPLTSRDETALHPAFSPAGDRIVFETVRNPGGSGFLESSDLSGDDRVDLTGPDQPIMSPHWGTASAGVCAVDDTRAKNQDGYYTGAGDPPNMAKKPLARGLAPPRIEKVAPRASIAGASVTLRGDGLDGKRLHARVDGRRAKLFERRGASVTLGLPAGLDEGRQRVEVRRGRHRAAGSVRIRASSDGELDAELDSANATTGSIGPAGGTLAATGADGTSFTLEVPAGALATTEQVTMTPVSRLVDSPFSGASEGVDLAPDGLAFTTPATLTIRRPGGFPPNTTGFAMGESLEIKRPSGTRRSLVLELDHFSTHGAGGLTEQDAVDTISGYLEDRKGRDLTRSEIRSLLTMIGIFEGPEYFPFPLGTIIDGNVAVLPDEPASFCARNAVCDEAQAIAQTSIRNLAKSACDRGKANPSAAGLAVLTEINNLSAEFQQLGGEGSCRSPLSRARRAGEEVGVRRRGEGVRERGADAGLVGGRGREGWGQGRRRHRVRGVPAVDRRVLPGPAAPARTRASTAVWTSSRVPAASTTLMRSGWRFASSSYASATVR